MSKQVRDQLGIREDKPADWFEPLYANANTEGAGVPWANMTTHPAFSRWLKTNALKGDGKQALVIGCGMGDDAIELEQLGFEVTAFDVSETAIALCKKRFPTSTVNFLAADLLEDQPQWYQGFDFVLEIYTVQALPPKFEALLIDHIAGFVAANGQLLVVAEVTNQERQFECGPPWLLSPDHASSFESLGLTLAGQYIQPSSEEHLGDTYTSFFVR